jgi:pimeloyl-ACP methyl ester carboxylesterase
MKKSTANVRMALAALLVVAVGSAVSASDKEYEVASTELQIPSRGIEIPATVVAPVAEADAIAMEAGKPDTPYQAVALMGPVAQPGKLMSSFFGSPDAFAAFYEVAQANGFAVVTTPFGQVQSTSLQRFDETMAADPVGDIGSFPGPVLILWGEAEQIIPYGEVEAYLAATEGSAASTQLVTIPDADHGYSFILGPA